MAQKIFNMTPYEAVFFHPCFHEYEISIPSSGVISASVPEGSEPSGFIGCVPEWDAGSMRPEGVPEHLEDGAVYIVTPSAAIALKAAGYDMSRFRLIDGARLSESSEGSAGPRFSLRGTGLADHLTSRVIRHGKAAPLRGCHRTSFKAGRRRPIWRFL